MISVGVLASGTMGGISAFLLLNRYAANLRNMSVARAMCQERIEQALTLPFRAPTAALPAGTMPAAPSVDAAAVAAAGAGNTPTVNILGTASSWNASTSTYTGGSNVQTATETIPIATQSENFGSTTSANITYTRTSTTSPAGLYYATGGATTSTSLNVLQFTVTVTYVFRGQTYSATMSTLRGPD